jgi:hypothetical protein
LDSVFGTPVELFYGLPAGQEEHVAVGGGSHPNAWLDLREPSGQVRKKQARPVQAVALPDAQNLLVDSFEAQRR